MKLNYFIQLIRDCVFNMVFINIFFFFPLSAISNKLITNLKLDGYIELYYFFFVFFSLPLAITIVITKEIYNSIKRKFRFEKHLEDDSERADDVAKKNRSDIYKGSSQVRRRSNRYEFKTPQTNFLFGRCVSCMTLIPLLVWESFLFTSYQKRKDWVKWKPESG